MSEQNVYEMLWDCKFCGTTKLLGKSQKFCPVCGAAQDPATRYYPSDAEKVAVKDHVYVGADLICGACGAPNSANAEHCTQCGAPLENAQKAGTLGAQMRGAAQQFESSGPRDLAKERLESDLGKARSAEDAAKAAARRPFIIGAVIAGVLAVIALVVFLFSTTQNTVLVTGHAWQREIQIEDFGPRLSADWRDAVPFDARGMSCTTRQRTTRQVPDGEDCRTVRVDQGDGTFREERQCQTRYRDEPVFDSWCTYTVDRWQYKRSVVAEGKGVSDPAPSWPDTQITNSGTCNGCEREGGRSEKYIVYLKDSQGDTIYECAYDQAKWAGLGVETVWTLEIRRTGGVVCDSIKAPG